MATAEFAGKTVELDADGNLVNLADWDQDIAKAIAVEEGVGDFGVGHERSLSEPWRLGMAGGIRCRLKFRTHSLLPTAYSL